MTTADASASGRGPGLAAHLRAGSIAGLVAAAVNVLLRTVGTAAGADLAVTTPGAMDPMVVPVGAVVAFSLLPVLVGGAVRAALLARSGARGARWWPGLVVAVTLVSCAPLLDPALSGATRAVLGLMHLVAGAAALWVLPRALGPAAPRDPSGA